MKFALGETDTNKKEREREMGLRCPTFLLLLCFASSWVHFCAAQASSLFEESFVITGADDHFKSSADGQIWSLSLDKKQGGGFQTKQKYRYGWFNMKLKLVGGDSAGVVTAYYMCSDVTGPGTYRDELDFEFLGNRSGQPYILQTNVYRNGVGNREMRHYLWFDPTADFHDYSILWNSNQIVFFADKVPLRVMKNNGKPNDYFPIDKPMYIISTIWNADDWATEGGLQKTNWEDAPFVSSYTGFVADACVWEEPFPKCASTTKDHWWDQSGAQALGTEQQEDFNWMERNLENYNYCKDRKRFPIVPEECNVQ